MSPSPSVPVLSKLNISPTLWLVPSSIISIFCIDPDSTVSISIFCDLIEFASLIKSFPALFSVTLYGNVFLLKDELKKSNDWSIDKLSFSSFDLYLSPIK